MHVGVDEDEVARRRRLYPKIRPYVIPQMVTVNNGWYEGEDCMDSIEVASPVCRVGRPNLDGSIGGYKADPLPPR